MEVDAHVLNIKDNIRILLYNPGKIFNNLHVVECRAGNRYLIYLINIKLKLNMSYIQMYSYNSQ